MKAVLALLAAFALGFWTDRLLRPPVLHFEGPKHRANFEMRPAHETGDAGSIGGNDGACAAWIICWKTA